MARPLYAWTAMRLSVIIPCYNEVATIEQLVARVQAATGGFTEKELIIIDDGSTDGTRAKLNVIAHAANVKVVYHERNRGKGAALRSGIAVATGAIILIQDADLEYDPADYAKLVGPIIDGRADVVFGSRFAGGESHRVLYFWHSLANRALTFASNCFTNINLTDVMTCLKAFRREVVQDLRIEEDGFAVEAELTAKVAARRCRIYEVGISYSGRTYEEGKKIRWRDGFRVLWAIFKYAGG